MEKKAFVTKEQIEEIVKKYPTPFHIYDEKGIRANAQAVKDAFSWNKGYREYFAVKALPNPFIMKILKEYGVGSDCSSKTELMLAEKTGITGDNIMFSSNDTPAEEFEYAAKIGATINLDDFSHIAFLEKTLGKLPERLSLRYNPGGIVTVSNGIMDNPGDAKYGMTDDQLIEGNYTYGMITNSRFVGGIPNITGASVDMNDGLFEVMLVRPPQTLLDLSIILNSVSTMKYDPRLFVYTQASELDFATEKELNWSIDGEKVSGGTSVHISCVHNGLSLITRDTPAML